MLVDECLQQPAQRVQYGAVTVDLIRPVFLDQADAFVLDVACDNPGKRPAQVGRQFMGRQLAAQVQVGHGLVGRVERSLEALLDLQQPVEVEGIVALAAELLDRFEAFDHVPGDFRRVINDDFVQAMGRFTQRGADESVQLLQIRLGAARAGEHHRERQVVVVRVHEDAQQVQELLRRRRHRPGR